MENENRTLMVTIRCATYNHEPYIRQCLDGFVMQKTNFRFEAIVHDDASTDKTAEIIKDYADKYPDIIVPIFETENQYSKHDGSLGRIMDEYTHGKYVAYCEGDDFWTDPLKLQKQYDMMEKHPDCTICFNRVQAVRKDGKTPEFLIPNINTSLHNGYVSIDSFVKEEFDLGHWCFHTSSFFVTNKISKGIILFKNTVLPSFPYGDMPLIMYALSEGKGFYIDEVMGCYRRFSGGFNSSIRADKEKRIRMARLVIKGCDEFDQYTNFRFHKMISKKKRTEEFYMVYDRKSFRIRHWEFLIIEIRKLLSSKMEKLMPGLYALLKKMRRKANIHLLYSFLY